MNWYIRVNDGQEDDMSGEQQPTPSEEEIRKRSYLIWEREGRPDGRHQEHWMRAKAELEAEFEANWRAASMEGETTSFVLPVLPISTPPSRSVADKITQDPERLKPTG